MKKAVSSVLVVLLLAFSFISCSSPTQEDSTSAHVSADIIHSAVDLISYEYLLPISLSGMGAESWDSANDIPAECFDMFYARKALPKDRDLSKDTVIPQNEYEAYIQQYFDVDSEHLRSAPNYDSQLRSYIIGYLGSSAPAGITDIETNEASIQLSFEYYSPADETTVIQSGTILIETDESGYRYTSCSSNEIR